MLFCMDADLMFYRCCRYLIAPFKNVHVSEFLNFVSVGKFQSRDSLAES